MYGDFNKYYNMILSFNMIRFWNSYFVILEWNGSCRDIFKLYVCDLSIVFLLIVVFIYY